MLSTVDTSAALAEVADFHSATLVAWTRIDANDPRERFAVVVRVSDLQGGICRLGVIELSDGVADVDRYTDGKRIPGHAHGAPTLGSYLDRYVAEQRATLKHADELADYHVLDRYDCLRGIAYGDMAGSRRRREINRLADRLINAGVPVIPDGNLPASSPAELVAAFERVARPRIRRLQRETFRQATRYTQASIDTWRRVARELGVDAGI